ncbi:hypothetical protein D0436_14675 [Shewanella decolorationis]|uniref:Uncharacterized protein n=1 Tax=Shewanella decolorationis TaxID=256839 RepID=A0A5B8QY37_9GAMM|nr:hypothetical protein [Shewanella decolorationis]QDZ91593.3 hypothetical protein D0436_14675 [Shewanella decolorationis]
MSLNCKMNFYLPAENVATRLITQSGSRASLTADAKAKAVMCFRLPFPRFRRIDLNLTNDCHAERCDLTPFTRHSMVVSNGLQGVLYH